jgi:hypothetical protein
MAEDIKLKIIKILDGIDEENILMQVMEDVAFYAAEKDIKNYLFLNIFIKSFLKISIDFTGS